MTVPIKTGTLTQYDSAGSVVRISGSSIVPRTSRCEDIVGNRAGNNPLFIEHVRKDYTPYNGKKVRTNGNLEYLAENYWDTVQQVRSYGHLPLNLSSLSGSQLAARTNPNKPAMDLPVFLFELHDLPGMLTSIGKVAKELPAMVELVKRAGETLLVDSRYLYGRRRNPVGFSRFLGSEFGNANLAYQFGWAPLLSDLLKLTGFAEAYENKRKQFTKLLKTGTLRRRVNIDSQSAVEVLAEAFHSSGFSSKGSTVRKTTADRWGVTRWEASLHPPESEPSQVELVRATLGLDLTPAQIWAAMPWSWMIDYFADIGSYLDAHRNTIPVRCEKAVVMTRTTTIVTRSISETSPWIRGGSGTYSRVTKERVPLTLSALPSSVPFLGANQVGILASLSVARQGAWKIIR